MSTGTADALSNAPHAVTSSADGGATALAHAPDAFWSRASRVYSGFFLLAFAVSAVMLRTDDNLWTGFGSMPGGYYLHWDVVAASAVADAGGAVLLWVRRTRSTVRLAVLGALLMTLVLVGAIFTYAEVGFASASDMADYLFGITYYCCNYLRYLYDALLGVYLATVIAGITVLLKGKGVPAA